MESDNACGATPSRRLASSESGPDQRPSRPSMRARRCGQDQPGPPRDDGDRRDERRPHGSADTAANAAQLGGVAPSGNVNTRSCSASVVITKRDADRTVGAVDPDGSAPTGWRVPSGPQFRRPGLPLLRPPHQRPRLNVARRRYARSHSPEASASALPTATLARDDNETPEGTLARSCFQQTRASRQSIRAGRRCRVGTLTRARCPTSDTPAIRALRGCGRRQHECWSRCESRSRPRGCDHAQPHPAEGTSARPPWVRRSREFCLIRECGCEPHPVVQSPTGRAPEVTSSSPIR
jgi:hypothetical protein